MKVTQLLGFSVRAAEQGKAKAGNTSQVCATTYNVVTAILAAHPDASMQRIFEFLGLEGVGTLDLSATVVPTAHADLLLVKLDRTFPLPEAECFRKNLMPCPHIVSEWTASKATAKTKKSTNSKEKEIAEAVQTERTIVPPFLPVLASSMRWCMVSKRAKECIGLK